MRDTHSKRKIILTILIALVVIGLFGLVLHLIENRGLLDEQFGDTGDWGDGAIETSELTFNDELYISNDSIDTYLVIGTDSGGEDLGEMYSGELADFLTLLLVDNTTEKFAFIQIDRNTMVDMTVPDESGAADALETMQLCISHWYGKDEDERNEYTADAVSTVFGGLDIYNWYSIEMTDIGAINHALGGVAVDINEDLTSIDPAFTKGSTVLLTDKQAEEFVRARMGVGEGTNKERMSRQTQYMQKAYNLVFDQVRENPEYINDIYDQLQGRIHSGESESNFSKMTNQIMTYESCGILQIDGKVKNNDTMGDGIIHEEFYADEDSILAALKKVMNLKLAPEDYGE